MSRLEDLAPNAAIRGIIPDVLVTVTSGHFFCSEKAGGTFVQDKPAFRLEAAKLVNNKRSIETHLAILQGLDPALGIPEPKICNCWHEKNIRRRDRQ